MPSFGRTSRQRLDTCDERLQAICHRAIEYYDFSVICGHRGKVAQNHAYDNGFSALRWPQSQHNQNPSLAVDLAPWPTLYTDTREFNRLATWILAAALEEGVRLTWGGHWRSFKDFPHFEIKES